MALAKNTQREWIPGTTFDLELTLVASQTVYEGSALVVSGTEDGVAKSAGSGSFAGFAMEGAVTAAGETKKIKVRVKGLVRLLAVTDTTDDGTMGTAVSNATDDDTFNVDASGIVIGAVAKIEARRAASDEIDILAAIEGVGVRSP